MTSDQCILSCMHTASVRDGTEGTDLPVRGSLVLPDLFNHCCHFLKWVWLLETNGRLIDKLNTSEWLLVVGR